MERATLLRSKINASLDSRVLRNTGLLGIANVLDRVIAFVLVVVIGRELGVVEFGRYSLGVALATIIFQFSSLGVDVIVRRDLARDASVLPVHLGNALSLEILSVTAGIGFVWIFGLVAGYDPETANTLVAVGVVFGLETLLQLAFAVFEARERMEYELAVMALRIVLLACLPVALALGWGLQGIFAAWIATNILRLALALWLIRSRFSPFRARVDLGAWKRMLSESYPLALALLFNVIYYRADAVMLSFYRSEAEVGVYNAAYSFLNVTAVLSVAFLRSVFPRFAQQVHEPGRLRRTFYRSLGFMGLAGLVVALLLTVFADAVIRLVFTERFAGSANALVILAWASFFLFLGSTCAVLLNATGRQKAGMYTTALMAAVNVGLNLWLIPKSGYIGASVATLLSYAVGFIVLLMIVFRKSERSFM